MSITLKDTYMHINTSLHITYIITIAKSQWLMAGKEPQRVKVPAAKPSLKPRVRPSGSIQQTTRVTQSSDLQPGSVSHTLNSML